MENLEDYVQFDNPRLAKLAFEMGNVKFKCVICGRIHNSSIIKQGIKNNYDFDTLTLFWTEGPICVFKASKILRPFRPDDYYYLALTFTAFKKYFIKDDKRLKRIYRMMFEEHFCWKSEFDIDFIKFLYDSEVIDCFRTNNNIILSYDRCCKIIPIKLLEEE